MSKKIEKTTSGDTPVLPPNPVIYHWPHLSLSAIATEDEAIPIGYREDGKTLKYHHRKEGDILHPLREGPLELARLKRELGSQRFSAQYQQEPLPLEGNLINRDWMLKYSPADLSLLQEQRHGQIVQSWDIATTTSNTAAWSVCTTWFKTYKDYYLLHVLRVKREFPELKKLVNSHCLQWDAKVLLIEKDGIGLPLFQALMEDTTPGVPHPIGIKAKGSKYERMEAQSATIEAGHMHIPEDAPWLADYLKELLAFPHAKRFDQVDSTSQFLNWAGAAKAVIIPVGPELIIADDDYGFGIDPDYPPTKHY